MLSLSKFTPRVVAPRGRQGRPGFTPNAFGASLLWRGCEALPLRVLRALARYAQGDKPKKWVTCAVCLFLAVATASRADRIDDLIKQIGSTNDEQRADAVDRLTQTGGARVQEQFRKMVASSSP